MATKINTQLKSLDCDCGCNQNPITEKMDGEVVIEAKTAAQTRGYVKPKTSSKKALAAGAHSQETSTHVGGEQLHEKEDDSAATYAIQQARARQRAAGNSSKARFQVIASDD